MRYKITRREVILFVGCLSLALYCIYVELNTNTLQKEKIISEERIKQYQKDAKEQQLLTDSLKSKVMVIEGVLEYQKQNPKIIIEKYDKVRNNINLLNADASILYLSNRLSEEGGNR